MCRKILIQGAILKENFMEKGITIINKKVNLYKNNIRDRECIPLTPPIVTIININNPIKNTNLIMILDKFHNPKFLLCLSILKITWIICMNPNKYTI